MKRLELLSGSLLLAATYHSNQRRKSDATPYINHILEVVDLLIDVGKVSDVHELCAAALHDSIEDTKITRKMIAGKFGSEVIDLVNALTDDKKLTLIERRAAALNKLSVAPNSVDEVRLIIRKYLARPGTSIGRGSHGESKTSNGFGGNNIP